jgi:hypothetical protein
MEACQSPVEKGRQSKPTTNDTEHQANLEHEEG